MSERDVTLSVCIPTFERPAMVVETIRSVIASAAANADEVEIVVSDNSPDVSEEACRRALADWPGRSLYLANRPDIGMVANFNQCVARASGRFVLFVHDDDRLLPPAVPGILDAVATAGADDRVLLFGVEIIDERGRLIRHRAFAADRRLAPADALRRVLEEIVFVPFPGYVVRADAYAAAGPFDARRGHAVDLDMFVRLLSRDGARCLPLTTSRYVVQPESATAHIDYDGAAVGYVEAIFELARSSGLLAAGEIDRYQAVYFHQMLLGATYSALRTGDVSRARRVMSLFGLPAVRRPGYSWRWVPMRLIFAALLLWPAAVVRPVVGSVERLDLVRRVRGTS